MKHLESISWRTKMLGKMVLSRIPLSYRYWRRLGIFKHGAMLDPAYAYSKFRMHYDRVEFSRKGSDFVVLELGPGDSLHSALIARSVGASKTYLVDVGRYASCPADCCRTMAAFLRQHDVNVSGEDDERDVQEMLLDAGAIYLTHGIESLAEIPDGSVDYIWSEAVLEHIGRKDFGLLLWQLKRILRQDGVCSHHVDLKDHLGGSLNHLRFSEATWESALFRKSGFYTNRIRYSEMLELFRMAGFYDKTVGIWRWPMLPLRRSSLCDRFACMTDAELCVSGFDVVLRPAF